MQSTPSIIKQLNDILHTQLTLINQHFLHARILKNKGLVDIGGVFYKRSIVQMKNADRVIERILLLEGLPNLQNLGRLSIGETPQEMIAADLGAENAFHNKLREAIDICEKEQDYVSRKLLADFKNDNEEQIDWLETQNELIDSLSLENYLQLAVI